MSLYVKNLDYQIGNDQILKQISLEIRDGEFVGLVGPNGCGKSTLLKHIYRTYKPKGGTIFLDGKDITEFSAKKMAGELAVMAQENQLEFDFTVRDMVMFGRYAHKKFLEGDTAKDRELCEQCLREVGLTGYENRSYLSLSGGEKQRISIARAILKDAPVIILDEATASIDPENEHLIQAAITELTKGKTIITIAHRLATVRNADQILVVEDGQIAEAGTHEELLKREGLYKRFTQIREKAEGWHIDD